MLLEFEKKVIETLEIESPSWYKNGYDYYFIGEDKVILVRMNQITMWELSNRFFNDHVAEAVKGDNISESEFMDKYEEVICSFNTLVKPSLA